MEAWHQKNLTVSEKPFNVIVTDLLEFPPHWHEQIEVVYVADGFSGMSMSLNNEIYELHPRDILISGVGDVHSFILQPQKSKRIILQFEHSLFEGHSEKMLEKRFVNPVLRAGESAAHEMLEKIILQIYEEHRLGQEGYKLAIKARLLDMIIVFMRMLPMEVYSAKERTRQLHRLERLEQVLKYVEKNYENDITLEEISREANFSPYHFTRFFRDATGMTFIQYFNSLKVSKAVYYLASTDTPVIDIAYKSGFNSVKTFNRVFKAFKGCSPSQYRKNCI